MSDGTYAAFQMGLSTVEEESDSGRDKKIVLLKVIVSILAILLLVEGLLYTLVIPCLAPAKVEFYGLKLLNAKDLNILLSESAPSSSWMQFDTAKAASVLSSVSAIESVSVDKHFPDRVSVHVQERLPVARSIASVNERSSSFFIDKNGVVFSVPGFSSDSSMPLVSGLPLEQIQDGMRLPSKYRPLMGQISNIRSLPQKYFAAISEICVVPKEYGNYELVLYPIHNRVRVLTDRSLDEEQLKYMMVLLDVVTSIEPNVKVVDLRYGAVSYRTTE